MLMCEWCGETHDVKSLCSAKPRWSRRGFLAMVGLGVAGLAIAPSLPELAIPLHPIGTRAIVADGRVYRYFRAGSTDLVTGIVAAFNGDVVVPAGRGDTHMAGIVTDPIKAGAYGWVQTWGPAKVLAQAPTVKAVDLVYVTINP